MLSTGQTATTELISNVLCYYMNSSPQIQVIQVSDGKNANWKKIVFPRQRILFEATPAEQLEVHTAREGNPECREIISCRNLQIDRVRNPRIATKNVVSSQQKSP